MAIGTDYHNEIGDQIEISPNLNYFRRIQLECLIDFTAYKQFYQR